MSTDEEIREVYDRDIAEQTKIVYDRQGPTPFYDGFMGFQIENLYNDLGIEKIICSDFTPKSKKWNTKKYISLLSGKRRINAVK